MIPYLDYTTPTFYDDITRRHPGAAGRQAGPGGSSPRACRRSSTSGRSPAEAVARPRRDGCGERPPGEPRARRLPVPAARRSRSSAAFVLLPAAARGVDLAVGLGRADRRRRGRGSRTTPTSSRTRSCAARSCTRWSCCSSTPCCRCVIGLLLAGVMARARVRGLALFRTILFLPQVIAMVVVAVMWKMIYDPDNGSLNRFLGLVRDRGQVVAGGLLAGAAVGRADRHLGLLRAGDGAAHRGRAEDPDVAV